MRITRVILVFTCLLLLSFPAVGADSDKFPWALFLPNLITDQTQNNIPVIPVNPEPMCSANRPDLCLTSQACANVGGLWYIYVEVCSAYTPNAHTLVGSWRDAYGEYYVTYYPDGTFTGVEFGIDWAYGWWAPVSPTQVKTSYYYGNEKKNWYLTLINNDTYRKSFSDFSPSSISFIHYRSSINYP